jgi:hypothetical protein
MATASGRSIAPANIPARCDEKIVLALWRTAVAIVAELRT